MEWLDGAIGGVIGALATWALIQITSWWSRPSLTIEFGVDYPFRSEAIFLDGERSEFVRVKVKNTGRGMAKRCKCYVRDISLNANGKVIKLPSEELIFKSKKCCSAA